MQTELFVERSFFGLQRGIKVVRSAASINNGEERVCVRLLVCFIYGISGGLLEQ